MRRCFAAWLLLARERWWKSQLASMESQVGLMELKIRGYEKRPVPVRRRAGAMAQRGHGGWRAGFRKCVRYPIAEPACLSQHSCLCSCAAMAATAWSVAHDEQRCTADVSGPAGAAQAPPQSPPVSLARRGSLVAAQTAAGSQGGQLVPAAHAAACVVCMVRPPSSRQLQRWPAAMVVVLNNAASTIEGSQAHLCVVPVLQEG